MSEPPRYAVELTERVQKALAKLPRTIVARVNEALVGLETNPRPRNYKKLRGTKDSYRIRVGNYRIIYHIEDKILHVLVVNIDDRKDVYR
jgi:mRNA interferase RelE/StbE